MMKVNRLNHPKINLNSPSSNCAMFIFCNLALIIFSKPRQTLSRKYRKFLMHASLVSTFQNKRGFVLNFP